MGRPYSTLTTLLVGLTLQGACGNEAREDRVADLDGLGSLTFPTSCSAEVSELFDRGVARLHSFEYAVARADFQAVAARDPECGMAHWGLAMSYWLHPTAVRPPAAFRAGNSAAERAEAIGAATDRELAYIAAINAFYGHGENRPHRVRTRAWSDAMRALMERFPEDTEARIFYAVSLLATADGEDASLSNQVQAAAILNELWPTQPDHPGIAHYLIHALDFPPLADQGLPAARTYARIAPSSSHALHMSSHIFTRRGLWDESIATNVNARDAARRNNPPGTVSNQELHAHDYLAYAYLQIDDEAGVNEIVEAAVQATSVVLDATSGFALSAIPARWVLERRDWAAAAALELPAPDFPWDQFEYARANTLFARAFGAARLGRIDEARAEVEKIHEVYLGLEGSPITGNYNWADNVKSMRLAAAAWVAHAEGRSAEAVELATAAARLDEVTGKHPRTPGALLPPRELLGDLLLELNRPADALTQYEQSLRAAPNRLNGLYGAARAAEQSADLEQAGKYYSRIVDMTTDRSTRPAVERARAYVEGSLR